MRGRISVLCASALILGMPGPATAAPTVVGTIPFPGNEPLEVEVYETGNKVLVTEDNTGKLYIFDGATHQLLNSVDVGSSALDMVVNETYGKAYVASDGGCCSTGFTQGNGKISIIDLTTNQLIEQVIPGATAQPKQTMRMGSDEVHDRVYFGFYSGFDSGFGVFNAADVNNDPTLIPDATPFPDAIEVNTVTNKVFLIRYFPEELAIVDGVTHAVEKVPWPAGSGGALDLAVNEVENKVYVTMLHVPGQAEIGILIHDRDTGSFKFVGRDDLEPLAFNQSSNRLFSGVQVGSKGGVVEGSTDLLTEIDLGDAGVGSIDVRSSTDNAYLATSRSTIAVSGTGKCATKFTTAPDFGGGIVASDVAINQGTGRVYVNNRQLAGQVTVLQDSGPACTPTSGTPPGETPTTPSTTTPAAKKCKGKKATSAKGTSKSDVIVGTAGRDRINAGAGNDLVCALGGNDRIRGGRGRDRLFGQGGKDRLFGQGGRDKLFGGGAADRLIGGGGRDRLIGGGGRDAEIQ
jgi:DNA-binding beta-propeller fold protein YncE